MLHSRADHLGVCTSALCLVHCLVAPLIVPLLPLTALGDHEEWVHVVLAIVVVTAASFAFGRGYRRHGRRYPLQLAGIGSMLILAALFLSHEPLAGLGLSTQGIVTSVGGILLILAHLQNLTLESSYGIVQCCESA
ncbi:MAG: MerC domain-containing protein [Bdellovibrionales bacterium]|nr:MerC domain-containing protein [Bdellovibrionales bacterium]